MTLSPTNQENVMIERGVQEMTLSDPTQENKEEMLLLTDPSIKELTISDSWYKLAQLCDLSSLSLSVPCSAKLKPKKEGAESFFVCRHHLVQSALATKVNQVLDAAILLHQQINMNINHKNEAKVAGSVQKRMSHLADYTAEQGNLSALRLLLHSTLVTRSIKSKGSSTATERSVEKSSFCSQRALYFAASNGHGDVVRVLLKQKAPARPEAIYTVCRNGGKDILFQLLDAGVRCHLKEALECAAFNSQWGLAKSLAQWIQEISWIGVLAVPATYPNMDPASCYSDKESCSPFKVWTQCHDIIGWMTSYHRTLLQ